jgi:hypothetical protein
LDNRYHALKLRCERIQRQAHLITLRHELIGAEPQLVLSRLSEMMRVVQVELRYSPDQPRVPAGSPQGGQWTSGESDPNSHSPGDDGAVERIYPLEYLVGGVVGSLGRLSLRSIRGLNNHLSGEALEDVAVSKLDQQAIEKAAKMMEDYLGGKPRIITDEYGDTVYMSGDRKIRFDINNPGNYDPHFQIEQRVPSARPTEEWIDATGQHHYYFRKD